MKVIPAPFAGPVRFRGWFVKVSGESLSELMQGVCLRRLGGSEHEPVRLDGESIDEKGLTLTAPPGDDAQRGPPTFGMLE